MTAIQIGPLRPAEAAAWRTLWQAFAAEVEEPTSDAVMDRTWTMLQDPAVPLFGLGARRTGVLAGFLVYAPIPYPWGTGSACYLIDIGVGHAHRRQGVARALIEHLAEAGRSAAWNHIFWLAEPANDAARRLYDSVARRSRLVRYDLPLAP